MLTLSYDSGGTGGPQFTFADVNLFSASPCRPPPAHPKTSVSPT